MSDHAKGLENVSILKLPGDQKSSEIGNRLAQLATHRSRFTVHKYDSPLAFKKGDAYEVRTFEGNVFTNQGLLNMWKLLVASGGSTYSGGDARTGVGTSTTAADSADTDLLSATKVYQSQDATYPLGNGSDGVTFRSTYTGTIGNFAWNEFVVDNVSQTINRAVSAEGTKTAGQTWVLTISLTIS